MKDDINDEFLRDVLRIALTSGLPRSQVASDVGVAARSSKPLISAPGGLSERSGPISWLSSLELSRQSGKDRQRRS